MALNNLVAASSGAAGAAFASTVLYPLDVLKTHLNRGVDHKGQKYAGPYDVLVRVLNEHGVLGFYKGLQVRTTHQIVQKFVFYYVYDGLRRLYRFLAKTKSASFSVNVVIGYIAGVATVLVANPLEVMSTRQQVSSKEGTSMGTMARLATMLREEGIASFYRGSSANFVLAANPAIENSVYDQIRDFLLRVWKTSSLSAAQAFWWGAVAKTIATFLTFPYIRTKVIMQANEKKGDGKGADLSSLQIMRGIVQDDGVLALWKGMAPQTVKAVLSSAVLLAAKEKIEVAVRTAILTLARSS